MNCATVCLSFSGSFVEAINIRSGDVNVAAVINNKPESNNTAAKSRYILVV